MGKIEEIHYNGLIEEFQAIGIDANIDFSHLKKKWAAHVGAVKTHYIGGKIVGFITLIEGEPVIYVSPEYQRQGIGSKLLEQSYIRDVWVIEGNTKAENFYKKNGFKPTDSRETTKLGHEITEIKWVRNADA